jgi:hypothetical protein
MNVKMKECQKKLWLMMWRAGNLVADFLKAYKLACGELGLDFSNLVADFKGLETCHANLPLCSVSQLEKAHPIISRPEFMPKVRIPK